MLAPILLVVAGQTAAPAPKPEPTFEEILDAANKAWYELPEVQSSFRMTPPDKSATAYVDYSRKSDREATWSGVDGKRAFEVMKDGVSMVILDHVHSAYSIEPAKGRPSWTGRKLEDLLPLEKDTVECRFSQDRGLILRTYATPLRVTFDGIIKGKSEESSFRLVTAEAEGRTIKGLGTGRIKFRGRLDVKKGFLISARVEANSPENPNKPIVAVWGCRDESLEGAVYTLDLSRVEGWTHVDQ